MPAPTRPATVVIATHLCVQLSKQAAQRGGSYPADDSSASCIACAVDGSMFVTGSSEGLCLYPGVPTLSGPYSHVAHGGDGPSTGAAYVDISYNDTKTVNFASLKFTSAIYYAAKGVWRACPPRLGRPAAPTLHCAFHGGQPAAAAYPGRPDARRVHACMRACCLPD